MPPVKAEHGQVYNKVFADASGNSYNAQSAVEIIENNNQFVWVEEKARWFSPDGKRQIWFEDGWKYDGGSGVIEEFTVVKKCSIYKSSYKTTTTNTGAFMNGHHGIQSDWALKRINKLSQEVMHMDLYNPENAPVVLLRDTYSASPHRNITNLQAARKSQITKTNYLFQKKQAEFELRQIKCPDNEINIYLSNADKYFKSIYEILKNKIENSNFSDSQKKYFDGELQKIFGTYFTK